MHVYSQGLSKRADEKLLWKGSSHSGFAPFIDTHLKQSIERALEGRNGRKEVKINADRCDVDVDYKLQFLFIPSLRVSSLHKRKLYIFITSTYLSPH